MDLTQGSGFLQVGTQSDRPAMASICSEKLSIQCFSALDDLEIQCEMSCSARTRQAAPFSYPSLGLVTVAVRNLAVTTKLFVRSWGPAFVRRASWFVMHKHHLSILTFDLLLFTKSRYGDGLEEAIASNSKLFCSNAASRCFWSSVEHKVSSSVSGRSKRLLPFLLASCDCLE